MAMGLFEKKIKKNNKETKIVVSKDLVSSEKSFGVKIPAGAYTILRAPRITEKASLMGTQEGNVYAFEVEHGASKGNIKNAVESLYKVSVKRVRTVHIPSKKRRLGKFQGFRKGFKKAYVTLVKGKKIDLGSNV